MNKYHLNYKGEAGQCTAQEGNCPFGGSEDHFSSPTAARIAYEAAQTSFASVQKKVSNDRHGGLDLSTAERWQLEARKTEIFNKPFDEMTDVLHDEISAIVKEQNRRNSVAPRPDTWESFPVPAPEDSKVIVEPQANDNQGYLGGRRWIGGKVVDGTYLSQKEAAKNIRSDIKAALKLGELPNDMHYSVRMNSGAWVTSVDIVLGTKGDNGSPQAVEEEETFKPNMKKIKEYLTALGNQYGSSDTNSQVDYFNTHNMVHVRYRDKWS